MGKAVPRSDHKSIKSVAMIKIGFLYFPGNGFLEVVGIALFQLGGRKKFTRPDDKNKFFNVTIKRLRLFFQNSQTMAGEPLFDDILRYGNFKRSVLKSGRSR